MAKISRCALPLHFRCTSVARTGGPSKAVAVAFRVSYTRMLQRQRASRCTGPLHFSLERNHSSPLQVQRAPTLASRTLRHTAPAPAALVAAFGAANFGFRPWLCKNARVDVILAV
jgi:hypothetical protein